MAAYIVTTQAKRLSRLTAKTKKGRLAPEASNGGFGGHFARTLAQEQHIMQNLFFVEVTDTYGGEANYCWVKRFKVNASSMRGAITKVARETGLSFRSVSNCNDVTRYNAKNACICAFVSVYENEAAVFSYVKTL